MTSEHQGRDGGAALLDERQALTRVAELEEALSRQTALVHEIDHRVKNNLQLISSLMLLQSRRIGDDNTRGVLRSMLERVTAVATVHRKLFQGDDHRWVDVNDFARDLVGDLAMGAGREDITITLDLEHVFIAAASAAPFALIINELVGNALKHAFPDRPGRIAVSVAADGDTCVLTVADDGVGLDGATPGFGSTIVQLLGRQLHATQDTTTSADGVRVVVRTPAKARL